MSAAELDDYIAADELRRDFEAATKKVHDAPTVTEGAAGHEARYAAAYSALVKAGLERPLRKRYRA